MFKKLFVKKRNIFGLQIADWLILAVGLAIFAIITLWTITKSSVWFDEAFGAYMIHFNFAEIFRYTAADVHPPLFYWLLKLWSMMFGNTELALRSMSVFFGGIAIIFGYLLTNRLFDKKVARVCLIFMIFSPMFVRYGQEMRMYTLVAAIALAATYVLTFAIQTKKCLPWIIYGLLVALGMWTHYFMAIIWVAHWVWRADTIHAIAKKGEFLKKFFSKEWIMAHIIAVAIFVPWVPFLLKQVLDVQFNGFWIPAVTPNTIPNFLTNYFVYQGSGNLTGWLALGFLLVFILLIVLAFSDCELLKGKGKWRQNYRLVAAVSFVPIVLLFLLSMPPLRSVFVDRYLTASTLAMSIFIGVTLAVGGKFIGKKLRAVVIIFVAGLMILGVTNVWYFGNYSKDANPPASNNAREIVQAVANKPTNGQPIIADSPWLFYESVFYSTNNHPVYFIEANTQYQYGSLDMLKYNDQHKIKDIVTFTKQNPIVWYIGLPRGADFSAPYSNWKPLQKVFVNDSINGNPAYEAIQYQVVN